MFRTLTHRFSILILLVTVAPNVVQAEHEAPARIIQVDLEVDDDISRASVRVTERVTYSELRMVFRALEMFGVVDIGFRVEPAESTKNLLARHTDKQVSILFSPDGAELFLTDTVDFTFTRFLCDTLTESIPDSQVKFRSLAKDPPAPRAGGETENAPSADDPFAAFN